MQAITANPARRISIPIDDLGVIHREFEYADGMDKRQRKATFNRLRKILVLFRLIDAKETVLSIARGWTADGSITVEITIANEVKSERKATKT